ncbi:MAG: MotA/TolQ/ExbB proton channel family protein [Zoogloea sp.]|nr:MotA/TolQ/ExbB proton channel family protein [Zoogloea sp.]
MTETGFFFSLARTDEIGRLVLCALLLMSLASWYQIALKTWLLMQARRKARVFLADAAGLASTAALERRLLQAAPDEAYAGFARRALHACRQWNQRRPDHSAITLSSPDAFLLQAFNRALAETAGRMDRGLSLLASVGATAPFVGLFGTVWGIYHALVAIGAEGSGSLDKVAGPVGEALIMTACGLAVAIPAVLAYNGLARANRHFLDALEAYGHDLLGLLATGLAPLPAAAEAASGSTATAGAAGVA